LLLDNTKPHASSSIQNKEGPGIKKAFSIILTGAFIRLFDFFREQHSVDVRKNTSSRNRDTTEEFVQFLVVLDSQSDVSGNDTALLVVTGSITSELQDLGAKVFQDSRKVNRCSSSHAGSVFSQTKVASDTTDGELKSSLG
jgi:hypothetical protein